MGAMSRADAVSTSLSKIREQHYREAYERIAAALEASEVRDVERIAGRDIREADGRMVFRRWLIDALRDGTFPPPQKEG